MGCGSERWWVITTPDIANICASCFLSRRVEHCRWRRWRNHWASIKWERPVAGTPSTGLILIFILSSSNSNNNNRHRAKPRPRTHVTHTATHIHTATVTAIRTNTNHPHRGRDGALQASSWVKVSYLLLVIVIKIELNRKRMIFKWWMISEANRDKYNG